MIETKGLRVAFGEKEVLKGIDLKVEEGEKLAVMGSSGGGKTTLLRAIAGLIHPSAGSVTVDGIDVLEHPEQARARMGMVFQQAALFDYMNVHDNVLFGVRRVRDLNEKESKAEVSLALQRVGLDEDTSKKMPSELSGGMRKRVGMARAIALRPKAMLYDEPTTGLDPVTTYAIDKLMHELAYDGEVTSIIVSHDVASVMRVADRVAFLHQGEIAFLGLPKEFESSDHPAIREVIDKSRATDFAEPSPKAVV
ncbi:ATP-binding cassette domain-containing protein [bacterium]|nr:MAG: ATP-binding cassette domain-containing protein [bacterium]